MLSSGTTIPGWKLIAGKRSREWNGEEDQVARQLKKLGLKVGEIYEQKLLSPAAAQKLEGKICTTERRRKIFAEMWRWKDGAPQLAPESSEKPSIHQLDEMFEKQEVSAPEQFTLPTVE